MGDDSEPIADGDGIPELGGDETPELTEERFAANLRAIREAAGMSQGRLADEMGARGWPWRQQTVTRVENGRRMVRLGEAKAVAEILETSLDKLTQPTGEMRVVELLSEWTHQAGAAWLAIKESTVQLLNAKGNLRIHPAVAGGEPASERVLEAVRDAGTYSSSLLKAQWGRASRRLPGQLFSPASAPGSMGVSRSSRGASSMPVRSPLPSAEARQSSSISREHETGKSSAFRTSLTEPWASGADPSSASATFGTAYCRPG